MRFMNNDFIIVLYSCLVHVVWEFASMAKREM